METTKEIKKRLEEIKESIKNENISYSEIAELQNLAEHIENYDVELLEWAGIPELILDKEIQKAYSFKGAVKLFEYLYETEHCGDINEISPNVITNIFSEFTYKNYINNKDYKKELKEEKIDTNDIEQVKKYLDDIAIFIKVDENSFIIGELVN